MERLYFLRSYFSAIYFHSGYFDAFFILPVFIRNRIKQFLKQKKKLYISLLKRTLLLILFGMIVNGLLKFQEYENTRFASVLGRIGLACFFAAVIYLNSSLRMELFWFFVILTGYWALITLVPVPHYGAGVLSPGKDLSAWVDQQFLPGKLHRKIFDPEGLLSTIPAIATAMLGIFTGQFLRWNTSKQKPAQKMLFMLAAAALLICTGLIWDIFFPINKTIWSSSFVLYAGGWSLLLFALFYGIIDVAEYKKWAQPFVWIGTNSILIYMAAHGLVNFESTSQFLFGGIAGFSATSWQHVIIWTGVLFLQLVLLRFYIKEAVP